jgi:class 3 adenylate cyclase
VRAAFEAETRREVEQSGGRVVQFLGDGVLATFPVPSDALRAAQRLVDAARRQGIEIRAGLHTGEIEASS